MRLLVASTLVWAFAVPVIHLACGMVTERIEVLCEEQEAGGHAAHEHATESLELHFAANSRGQTSESLAECCLVDADALDQRAALVSMELVQAPVSNVLFIEPVVKPDPVPARPESDVSTPIPLRFLFSVFLI